VAANEKIMTLNVETIFAHSTIDHNNLHLIYTAVCKLLQ